MDWYEEEVSQIEQAHRLAPPLPASIVFYGSSSFRLWGTLAEDMAPWPVINRAFGGSTLAACVHFFERLVPPCRPSSLVLYAGDNDLGDGQSAQAVIASFYALMRKIDAQLGPIPLAFVSIKPSPARQALRPAIITVNEAVRLALLARPRGLFIDIFQPMLNRDGQPCPTLFAEDGLHLSPAGYHLWSQIIHAYRLPLYEP
ncbi:MAG: GDSL family lipase [Oscillochloris sp.]|nr:GDSL family lipase [Oscillochloris sp.]